MEVGNYVGRKTNTLLRKRTPHYTPLNMSEAVSNNNKPHITNIRKQTLMTHEPPSPSRTGPGQQTHYGRLYCMQQARPAADERGTPPPRHWWAGANRRFYKTITAFVRPIESMPCLCWNIIRHCYLDPTKRYKNEKIMFVIMQEQSKLTFLSTDPDIHRPTIWSNSIPKILRHLSRFGRLLHNTYYSTNMSSILLYSKFPWCPKNCAS
jgi:hypothetical protein